MTVYKLLFVTFCKASGLKTVITYVFMIMTSCVSGQFCATSSPFTIPADFHEYQKRPILTRSGKVDTVIIYPIVPLNENGTPSVKIDVLDRIIDETNDLFKNIDIYFRMCSNPHYVQDEGLWELEINNSMEIHEKYGQYSVINLYVPSFFYLDNGNGAQSSICGISTFPSENLDTRLTIINGECISDLYVLAHELGHYYGLYHTHENSLGTELVRRINCDNAGDLMCDTEADPKLSEVNTNDCTYIGRDRDYEGKAYNPPVRNVMSYSPFECKVEFTTEQYQRMRYVHEVYYSSYSGSCVLPDFTLESEIKLNNLFISNKIDVAFIAENIGKMDGDLVPIEIYLANTAGTKKATLHSLLVDIKQGEEFSFREEFNYINPIKEEEQFLVVEIDPRNEIREYDKSNNIAKDILRFDAELNLKSEIYPNPFQENIQISIADMAQKGDVNLIFYNAAGEIVRKSVIRKDYLNFYHNEDLNSLPPGIYILFVMLENELHLMKKVVKI